MDHQARGMLAALALLAIGLPLAKPANILAVFPHTGKSHYFMFQPFVYKLAERGHKVTVITHFPDDKPPPNLRFVSIRVPSDTLLFNSFSLDLVDGMAGSLAPIASVLGLRAMGIDACQKGLSHPSLQAFLKEPNQFDLAIVEFFDTDCFVSLAHYYKAPLVGIFSSAMMPWHNDRFGNPDNPSYINNHFLQLSSHMNFWQRTKTTLMTFGTKIIYPVLFNWPADALVKEFIGPDIPSVGDIANNASLYLINSHFSLFQARPLVPGIIELGGFHVSPPTGKIPADILKVIEESPHGVVFFSLGSTVRGSTMPEYKLKIFQEAFSKLPQRVLWKWEDDSMPGKPENVFIGKWFPQNEILAHPNVKLFITHGGLMGTEEAVYHGVPMLLMPLLGDQPLNAAACVQKGVGAIINYFTITEEELSLGLKTVLEDKRYAENSKQLAKIFLDRPLSIMDTAIYWTEYVIRYRGAPQLRSAAADLTWYQEYLLDVLAALIVALAATLYITKKAFCAICCRKDSKKSKRE